ncbi:DUF58 domain-containing protein [Caldivirga maquilingensis]|uniref:Uncharacterized protein n=1 Tax=Caldivirga maquilingensis (strain ATCC 700844 / DSM 13496 / JCM 10307 / IC-167) TaxID=397948 RepID=A8MC74_CALMQ|nr:DUF58 domain-containing protein [Caldivirga maquilingensis]ABW01380.1 protein of unknown function DUF58 [Caldivirga maquilingensis IC-167]
MVSAASRVKAVLRTLTRRQVIDQIRAVAQPLIMVVVSYIGFINGSPQLTIVASLALLFYTSYALSWYVSRTVELRSIKVELPSHAIHRGEGIRVKAPIGVEVKPIVSRHVVVKGDELIFKWSGVARLLGFLLTAYDSLTGLTLSRFQQLKSTVMVLPGPLEGAGIGASRLLETGAEEYRGLVEYDYSKPASRIHWPSSAKVDSLIAKDYSEEAARLTVSIPALPELLTGGDVRPIDRVLMVLEELARQHGLIRVLLIGPGISESINVSVNEVPIIEGLLVDAYSWARDENEVRRLSRLINAPSEEAAWVVYPNPKPNEEGWDYFIVNATGHLAIIPGEEAKYAVQLRRRGIETLVV